LVEALPIVLKIRLEVQKPVEIFLRFLLLVLELLLERCDLVNIGLSKLTFWGFRG
jgi:hypothetical protein